MKTWYRRNDQGLCVTGKAEEIAASFTEDKVLMDYMADLALLKNVPIQNLVADSSWLPKETLLLFHIDPDWIECLLDGALSIGRDTTADRLHDRAVKKQLSEKAKGLAGNRRNHRLGLPQADEASGDVLSGFLLYSDIVRGWPGLEIRCYAGKEGEENPLPYLRFEKISSDILLGIVSGSVDRVVFADPDEGLHMGFDKDQEGKLVKRLKQITPADTGAKTVEVSYRDEATRVIDVLSTKKAMEDALDRKKDILSPGEFGQQMIKEPGEYTKIIEEV